MKRVELNSLLLVAACLVWAVFVAAPLASAQEPEARAKPEPQAIERWRALSPDRQRELSRRFETFRSLSPEAREVLRERGRAVLGQLDQIPERVSGPERARLLALDAKTRREVVGDYLRAWARFKQPGPRASLPPELREELERAGPALAPMVFERARAAARARIGERALERFGPQLGLNPSELEGLRGLPPEQRAERLREHLQDWQRLDLPPKLQEFLKKRLPPAGAGPGFGPRPFDFGPLPEARFAGPEGLEGPDLGPEGPPPDAGGPPPLPPWIARRLLAAAEPRMADFLDSAERGQRLTPPELEQRQRQRVQAEFPRLADLPEFMRRDFERAPLPLRIERAHLVLEAQRRPWPPELPRGPGLGRRPR